GFKIPFPYGSESSILSGGTIFMKIYPNAASAVANPISPALTTPFPNKLALAWAPAAHVPPCATTKKAGPSTAPAPIARVVPFTTPTTEAISILHTLPFLDYA
ncbi:MAG: hypothetical protein KDJ32_09660, partial [Alphaproteobacteria bacterium]|nr:hypothetical protein [Alphaproteobacteria bacterium]